MSGDYVELHAKSFYSFGLGASHVHELLAQAVEYGCDSLALTDANLCGALDFARQANGLGIRPITGGEITLADGSRLTLLARTREGYGNISRLFSLANAVDRRKPRLDPRHLPRHAGGVVLLTGGRNGPLSTPMTEGRRPEALRLLRDWLGLVRQRGSVRGATAELHAGRRRAQPGPGRVGRAGRRGGGRHQRRPLPHPGALPAATRAGGRQPQHHH